MPYTRQEMEEILKRIRNVDELPEALMARMKKSMPDGEPVRITVANFMTDEELLAEEDRVREEMETKEDDELTIWLEEEVTFEEKDEMPEGSLVRDDKNAGLYLKVLDLWMPYKVSRLKQPSEPLGKYGRMRRKFLEKHRARQALEWGEDLLIHCKELEDEAREMKHSLMERLEERDPPPSRDDDPMGWVQHMNSLDMQAEEIVTRTLVYAEP
ncbi:MAG: TnpV protein [Synergistaceae bacterium]|nr:TnpV protein [Synergistaceae bacterium]